MSEDVDAEVEIHPIEVDMQAMTALPRPPRPRRAEDWKPLFLPTQYSKDHPDICLEQYRLGEKRLQSLGEDITKHRKRLRENAMSFDKAMAAEQDKDVHEVSCLARRIRRGDYNDGALRKMQLRPDYPEHIPDGARRRMKKRSPPSLQDKISIVH